MESNCGTSALRWPVSASGEAGAADMSFFVTSVGGGKGADFGGLAGADGTAFSGTQDKTCGNWTKSGEGSAIVGHHNRNGTNPPPAANSWNSSHATAGCSDEALRKTGGAGLLYCFAVN